MSHKIGRFVRHLWTPDSIDFSNAAGATFNGYRCRNLATGNSTLIMNLGMQGWDGLSNINLINYYAPNDAGLGDIFVETRVFVGSIGTDTSTIVPVTNTLTIAMPGINAAMQRNEITFLASSLVGLTPNSQLRVEFERQAGNAADTYASTVRWFNSIVEFPG